MKKIFSLILLAALCLCWTSCSDDKGEPVQLSTIKVLAAETSFESSPSTGKVVVDCSPINAYVDAEDRSWLDVQIDKDTVKLSAKRNVSNESRNAMLTIKKNDNDSVMLNVAQKGMIFMVEDKTDIMQHTDLAQEYSFNVSSEILGQIISAPSWIEANMTKDKLNIKVLENNEGHVRDGYVKYACGNMKDSIKITQYELAKDLLGDYEIWVGYDENTDLCEAKLPATITSTKTGAITLNFSSLYNNTTTVNFQMPLTFSADSLAFSMTSGQQIGSFKNKKNKWTYFYAVFADKNDVYLRLQDASGNILLNDKTGHITAMMQHENGKGTYGSFTGLAYNNSGNVADFGSILVGAFSSSTPYESYLIDNQWAFSMKNMMLVRKDK